MIDLFAGSGALGIEALSRGAGFAEFVDIDPRSIRAIAANLAGCGALEASFRLRRADAWRRLDQVLGEQDDSRIVILDPPYEQELPSRCLPPALSALDSGRLRAFALEHPADAPAPDLVVPQGLLLRRRRHGHGAFTLLTRRDA